MKANREYIAVMGTMGSGKTTAARLIAKELPFTLAEEHVTDNAFLPRFYKDMKRWAFHSQVFFLLEKLQHADLHLKEGTLYPMLNRMSAEMFCRQYGT